MRNKLSRQEAFEKVWSYYVVEGMPYAVKENERGFPEPRISNTQGYKSPLALLDKVLLHPHVDAEFIQELQSYYMRATRFAFNNVNVKKVRDFYARKYTRAFRKTMKYFLIAFGMNYDLTIPSERAITARSILLAAKNKQ